MFTAETQIDLTFSIKEVNVRPYHFHLYSYHLHDDLSGVMPRKGEGGGVEGRMEERISRDAGEEIKYSGRAARKHMHQNRDKARRHDASD